MAKLSELDLSKTLAQYYKDLNNYCLSTKQKNYISALFDLELTNKTLNIDCNSNDQENYYFKRLSELAGHEIKNWTDLKAKEVTYIIYILKNKQPITLKQKLYIKSKYPDLAKIAAIVKREITSYDSLTRLDAKKLLTSANRFSLKSKDYPLTVTVDYEYGYQESKLCQDQKMYYLKFYNLLMLDYDNKSLIDIKEILKPYKEKAYFKIYSSFNGYHVFLLSETISYSSDRALYLMESCQCDHYYRLFCYKNGYKIRLSKKLNRHEKEPLYTFITFYGNPKLLNCECNQLIEFHDNFISSS